MSADNTSTSSLVNFEQLLFSVDIPVTNHSQNEQRHQVATQVFQALLQEQANKPQQTSITASIRNSVALKPNNSSNNANHHSPQFPVIDASDTEVAYLLLWSQFLLMVSKRRSSAAKEAETQQEIRVTLSQIEYKSRELLKLLDSHLDEAATRRKIDLNVLLSRAMFEKFSFSLSSCQAQQIEKAFQEMVREIDEAYKKFEKSFAKSTSEQDIIRRATILYYFGCYLKRWVCIRTNQDRWEPLLEQAVERLKKSLDACETNKEHGVLSGLRIAGTEKLGYLYLYWVKRIRQLSSIYQVTNAAKQPNREKLFTDCCTIWAEMSQTDTSKLKHYASALYEHALYLVPSGSVIPPSLVAQFNTVVVAVDDDSIAEDEDLVISSSLSSFDMKFQSSVAQDKSKMSIKTDVSPMLANKSTNNAPRISVLKKDQFQAVPEQLSLQKREELLYKALTVAEAAKNFDLAGQINFELAIQKALDKNTEVHFTQALDAAENKDKSNDLAMIKKGETYFLWAKKISQSTNNMGGTKADLLFRNALDCWQESTLCDKPETQFLISAANEFRAQNIILDGFMLKQGEMMKNWKERYFVLTADQFCYYDNNKKTKKLKKMIQTSFIKTVKIVPDVKELSAKKKEEFKFFLTVEIPRRTFVLCFRNEKDLNDWAEGVNYVIDAHTSKKTKGRGKSIATKKPPTQTAQQTPPVDPKKKTTATSWINSPTDPLVK